MLHHCFLNLNPKRGYGPGESVPRWVCPSGAGMICCCIVVLARKRRDTHAMVREGLRIMQ